MEPKTDVQRHRALTQAEIDFYLEEGKRQRAEEVARHCRILGRAIASAARASLKAIRYWIGSGNRSAA